MDGLLSTVQQYVSTEALIWLTALSFVFFYRHAHRHSVHPGQTVGRLF
jgi:hypothetical protein